MTPGLVGTAPEAVEQTCPLPVGDSRAAVFDRENDAGTDVADLDAHTTGRAGVLAGVVDEHSCEAVDPLRRRDDCRDPIPDVIELELEGSSVGKRGETRRANLGDGHDVDGVGRWGRRGGVEAGEPQHVVDDPLQALALIRDPLEGGRFGLALKAPGQGELRLDHAEGSAQFVGGVGGELELAAVRQLDRLSRPETDEQGREEHRDEEYRSGEEL